MKILSKDIILLIHKKLINDTGGIFGIRDESLLESAIFAPFAEYDNIEAFPSVIEKAARLAFGIIKNHPFIDGNKRTGIMAMQMFLYINGIKLICDNNNLVELGLGIATGKMNYQYIVEWLKINTGRNDKN